MIYPHVLADREQVVEWMKGSLLTEYEKHLTPEQFAGFTAAYRDRLLPLLEPDWPFSSRSNGFCAGDAKRSGRTWVHGVGHPEAPAQVATELADMATHEGRSRLQRGLALQSAIIALGASLSLDVIAEGIELPEQEKSLQDLGCEIGQGFLFARPMGADALVGFLNAQPEDADVGVPPASNAA